MDKEFEKIAAWLSTADVGRVRYQVDLAQHTTWRIGGPAAAMVEPQNAQQISRLLKLALVHDCPLVVIGQGSNLLFDSAGLRGIVIKIGHGMDAISIVGETIRAQGGAWVPQLARLAMNAGLTGLEHCIGIPGTVGGLVLMNGGSHRHGIGENVRQVTVVTRQGEIQELSHQECDFSYRHSALQENGSIVTDVVLQCPSADKEAVRRAMLEDLRQRRGKFPRKQPNCGSVFLSTAAMHASVGPPGKIIEEAGLKGVRRGGAEISCQHANFIVNTCQATSTDVLSLIALVRQRVRERIGFEMCCEVRYVSPDGVQMPAHEIVRKLFEFK